MSCTLCSHALDPYTHIPLGLSVFLTVKYPSLCIHAFTIHTHLSPRYLAYAVIPISPRSYTPQLAGLASTSRNHDGLRLILQKETDTADHCQEPVSSCSYTPSRVTATGVSRSQCNHRRREGCRRPGGRLEADPYPGRADAAQNPIALSRRLHFCCAGHPLPI